MSRGTFISVDSADTEIKHLYADIVENLADYEAYFIELGLRLESGDGYFYFSRPNESRITIEQKLQSFAQWVDILDFLKHSTSVFLPARNSVPPQFLRT